MPRPITEAMFDAALPGYVEEGRAYADAIIEKGVQGADGIRSFGRHMMRIGWRASDELAGLWEARDEKDRKLKFAANVVLDSGMLAVERSVNGAAAWLFRPPGRSPVVPSEEHRQDSAEASPEGSFPDAASNWAEYLKSPVWTFHTDTSGEPLMHVGLYHVPHASTGVRGVRDVKTVSANDYRRSVYPPFAASDEKYLEHGVYTLHTQKVEHMLRILRSIAEE